MKPFFSVVAIMLAIAVTRCTTITPSYQTPADEATIILVECTNQRSIHTNVVLLLRQERVSDWAFRDLGDTEEIEAKYAVIHPGKAEYIKDMLAKIAGVISVEIKKEGMPLRNRQY